VFEGTSYSHSLSLSLSAFSLFPSLSVSLSLRLRESRVTCARVLRACVSSKAREKKNEEFSFPNKSPFFQTRAMTTTTTAKIRAPTTTTLSRRPLVVVVAKKRRNTKTRIVVVAAASSGEEEIDDDEEKERAKKKQNLTTTSTREYYEGFFKSPLGEQSVDGNIDDGGRRRDSIAPTIKFALNSSLVVGALLLLFLASNGLL
jgi:hypothetical protein